MQLLGSLGNGVLDDRSFRVFRTLRAVIIHIDPLICGRLRPVDRIGARCCNAAQGTVRLPILRNNRKLPQHTHEGSWQRLQTEVGVPDTQIKLISHSLYSNDPPGSKVPPLNIPEG
jgi:hypothetical protein